jgi:hypothetical protein
MRPSHSSDSLLTTFQRLVEKTLSDVDPSRRCFRSIGGVLVERTVKEVLPAITANKEQVRGNVGWGGGGFGGRNTKGNVGLPAWIVACARVCARVCVCVCVFVCVCGWSVVGTRECAATNDNAAHNQRSSRC